MGWRFEARAGGKTSGNNLAQPAKNLAIYPPDTPLTKIPQLHHCRSSPPQSNPSLSGAQVLSDRWRSSGESCPGVTHPHTSALLPLHALAASARLRCALPAAAAGSLFQAPALPLSCGGSLFPAAPPLLVFPRAAPSSTEHPVTPFSAPSASCKSCSSSILLFFPCGFCMD